MEKYQPRITKQSENNFYALIVRVDSDGSENVINGYSGRYFTSLKRAEKSTNDYINKHQLNG